MQLMIDILQETPAALRLASRFLFDHAALRDALDKEATVTPTLPLLKPLARRDALDKEATVTPAASNIAAVPMMEPPLFHPADLARAQADMNRTEAVPPGPSAIPAIPPLPPGAAPFVPPAPVTTPSTAAVPAVPVVPIVSNVLPLPLTAPVTTGLDEYDSSGVPFDGRIHQKKRSKKLDGTWKIQKGLDPTIVSAVMQELAPRIRAVPTPAVSLPPASQPGANISSVAPHVPAAPVTPAIPNPADVFGKTPLPVGAPAPVPLPPIVPQGQAQVAPQGQIPAQSQTQDPFRALVRKITEARNAGRLSPEEVTTALANAGAPSLQLLNNMPHLLPQVEANIDAVLATR